MRITVVESKFTNTVCIKQNYTAKIIFTPVHYGMSIFYFNYLNKNGKLYCTFYNKLLYYILYSNNTMWSLDRPALFDKIEIIISVFGCIMIAIWIKIVLNKKD